MSEDDMIINGNISEDELKSLGVLDDISGRLTRASDSPQATEPKTEPDSLEGKKYDFFGRKRALGDESIRLLEEVHNKFAVNLRNFLSTRLRLVLDVNMGGVEESSYAEFIEPLQENQHSYITIIRMLSGKALLHIDLNLAFIIVDRLLGGEGEPIEETRQLNEVELKIMEKIIAQALDSWGEAWENFCEIESGAEDVYFNPQFVDIGAEPGDTVIVISFEVNRERGSMGKIQLCIPYATFQPVRQRILSGRWRGRERATKMEKSVMEVLVPVICQIGENTVTLRELLRLKPDDVVMLNQEVDDLAKIVVGKTVRFLGKPGIVGGKYGVRIVSEVKQEVEEYETEQEDRAVEEIFEETSSP